MYLFTVYPLLSFGFSSRFFFFSFSSCLMIVYIIYNSNISGQRTELATTYSRETVVRVQSVPVKKHTHTHTCFLYTETPGYLWLHYLLSININRNGWRTINS